MPKLFFVRTLSGMPICHSLIILSPRLAVGRPYIYGLALNGSAGVEEQIKSILADFELTMGLCGYKSVAEIWGNREMLQKEV